MDNAHGNKAESADMQYPGEDTCYTLDDIMSQFVTANGPYTEVRDFEPAEPDFDDGDAPVAEEDVRAPSSLDGSDDACAQDSGPGASDVPGDRREAPERLSLEEQLRQIAECPDDCTSLYGMCDRDMLKVLGIISPLLEMRGAAGGFAYVNPLVSLARAMRNRGMTSAGINVDDLENLECAAEWLADAWESQGSATAMEIMRNLVVREVLNDPELRFIVLSRIERCFNVVTSAYEDAHIDFRGKRAS